MQSINEIWQTTALNLGNVEKNGISLREAESVSNWGTAIKSKQADILNLQKHIAFQRFQDINNLFAGERVDIKNFKDLNKNKRIFIHTNNNENFSLDTPGIFIPILKELNENKGRQGLVGYYPIELSLEANNYSQHHIIGFVDKQWLTLTIGIATVDKDEERKILDNDQDAYHFFKSIDIHVNYHESFEELYYELINIASSVQAPNGKLYSALDEAFKVGRFIYDALCRFIFAKHKNLLQKMEAVEYELRKIAYETYTRYGGDSYQFYLYRK